MPSVKLDEPMMGAPAFASEQDIKDDQYIESINRGDFDSAQKMVDDGLVTMNRRIFDGIKIKPEDTQRGTKIPETLVKEGIISVEEFSGGKGLVYVDGK